MELLQLSYFVQVAKLGSVTKAAKALHVSQPALSKTIHRLETELDARLFEKDGKGIKLTTAGHRFYTRISHALHGIQDATEDLKSKTLKGHVTIGSYTPLAPIIPCLREFSEHFPEITFSFLAFTEMSQINRDEIDAILCYAQSDVMGFREHVEITEVPRTYVLPVGHVPPINGHYYLLPELVNDTFVSLQWSDGRHEEIFSEFSRLGIVPDIRYSTNSSLFKQELLEAGLASGFSNAMVSDQFRPTEHYFTVPHAPEELHQKVFITWRVTEMLSPAAREFQSFLNQWFSRSSDIERPHQA